MGRPKKKLLSLQYEELALIKKTHRNSAKGVDKRD